MQLVAQKIAEMSAALGQAPLQALKMAPCSSVPLLPMSLPHALLTALVEHPCSGSELAERFDRSIGYFWNATHQQIYRELAPLREEWMVRLRAEAVVGPCGLQEEVQRLLELHQSQLGLYQRLEQRDFLGKPPTRERRLQHLVLKAGLQHEQLWIGLLQEAREILDMPARP
jgi:DNA-binding PadR family transcriptional regulator